MPKLTNRHSDLTKDREYYYLRLLEKVIGRGGGSADLEGTGYYILLYDVSAGQIEEYPFTEAGLNEALAASSNGDRVWIPPGTITLTAGITVNPGATMQGASKEGTILTANGTFGTLITGGIGSIIEMMTVDHTDGSSGTKYAILGNRTIVRNLTVNMTNSYNGAGNYCRGVVLNGVYYEAGKKVIAAENLDITVVSPYEVTDTSALYAYLGAADCEVILRNINAKVTLTNTYGDCDSAVIAYNYGGATSRMYLENVNIEVVTTGAYNYVTGIYANNVTYSNSIVKCTTLYCSTGIEVWGDSIVNNVHATVHNTAATGTRFAVAISADDTVKLYSCTGKATGGTSSNWWVGIFVNVTSTVYAYNCIFEGVDCDIFVNDNVVFYVSSCTYNPAKVILDPGASIVILPGSETIIEQSTSSFSDPPLASELTAVFGSPEDLGAGQIFTINNDGNNVDIYMAITADTGWWVTAMTKAQDFISKTDSITVGESVLIYLGGWPISESDNIAVGESVLVYTGGWSVSESDAIAIGEIVTVQVPFTGGFPVLESDAVAVSDIVTVSIV